MASIAKRALADLSSALKQSAGPITIPYTTPPVHPLQSHPRFARVAASVVVNTSYLRLAQSAIRVGSRWRVRTNTPASAYRALSIGFLFLYCFQRNSGGRLVTTRLFRTLDPSETRQAKYHLGMAVAHRVLVNRRVTNWLMHLGRFRARNPKKGPTQISEADLIGPLLPLLTKGQPYVVCEAKGTEGDAARQLRRAMAQLDKQSGPFGPPHLGVASVADIGAPGGLSATLVDPAAEQMGDILQDSPAKYLSRYYEPWYKLVQEIEPIAIGRRRIRLRRIDPLDAWIGLDQRIFAAFSDTYARTGARSAPAFASQLAELFPDSLPRDGQVVTADTNQESVAVDEDGIAVVLGDRWLTREVVD